MVVITTSSPSSFKFALASSCIFLVLLAWCDCKEIVPRKQTANVTDTFTTPAPMPEKKCPLILITGVAVGVVIVGFIGVVVFVMVRRHQRAQSEEKKDLEAKGAENPEDKGAEKPEDKGEESPKDKDEENPEREEEEEEDDDDEEKEKEKEKEEPEIEEEEESEV